MVEGNHMIVGLAFQQIPGIKDAMEGSVLIHCSVLLHQCHLHLLCRLGPFHNYCMNGSA